MTTEAWSVALDQPDDVVAALGALLDDHERSAVASRSRVAAARRYQVAHGALRELLGRVAAVEPGALVIDRTCRHCGHPAHGRPFVRDRPDVSFSLSHSGSTAVVAIGGGEDIGIDVETVRPRRSVARLAARVMAGDEFAEWNTIEGDSARLHAFLETWTAKEAVLKARGLGLRGGLRETPARPEEWDVRHLRVTGAVAALAVPAGVRVGAVARWQPEPGGTLTSRW
jgi:4'-phosphopantetheinyl transferase